MRIVLATAAIGFERDRDLALTVDALRAEGLEAEAVAWDTPGHDWAACDRLIIRSTWDYGERLAEYLAWTDSVSALTRLHNPAEVVRWNSDKHYLGQLAELGVPTVPTTYLGPGEEIILPTDGSYVVKPTVSAGAKNTARYLVHQRTLAEDHVKALHAAGATAMVQPYLDRIAEGERALVFLGGEFSHALRKGPVITDIGVIDNARIAHPDLVEHQPSAAELAVANAALRAIPGADPVLIARVDLALVDDGSPVVMELELIEPNLFFFHNEQGLRRFAEVVGRSA